MLMVETEDHHRPGACQPGEDPPAESLRRTLAGGSPPEKIIRFIQEKDEVRNLSAAQEHR
jgi:hypothetical protein